MVIKAEVVMIVVDCVSVIMHVIHWKTDQLLTPVATVSVNASKHTPCNYSDSRQWEVTCHENISTAKQHFSQQTNTTHTHTHTTVLRPFFRDHPGEPVPEENF